MILSHFSTNSVVFRQESEVTTMSCECKAKAAKTETNNKWCGERQLEIAVIM